MALDGNIPDWKSPEEEDADPDCNPLPKPDYIGFGGFVTLFVVIGAMQGVANLWERAVKLPYRLLRRG